MNQLELHFFWTALYIKGRMWAYGLVWMFEKERDAMWFKLRWLNG